MHRPGPVQNGTDLDVGPSVKPHRFFRMESLMLSKSDSPDISNILHALAAILVRSCSRTF